VAPTEQSSGRPREFTDRGIRIGAPQDIFREGTLTVMVIYSKSRTVVVRKKLVFSPQGNTPLIPDKHSNDPYLNARAFDGMGWGMRKKRDRAQLETRRLQGARLLRRGVSRAEVARRVGVSRTLVFCLARALETNGRRALRKAPRTGRPPLLTDTEKKRSVVALEAGALATSFLH
jgi:transposase-like protein